MISNRATQLIQSIGSLCIPMRRHVRVTKVSAEKPEHHRVRTVRDDRPVTEGAGTEVPEGRPEKHPDLPEHYQLRLRWVLPLKHAPAHHLEPRVQMLSPDSEQGAFQAGHPASGVPSEQREPPVQESLFHHVCYSSCGEYFQTVWHAWARFGIIPLTGLKQNSAQL